MPRSRRHRTAGSVGPARPNLPPTPASRPAAGSVALALLLLLPPASSTPAAAAPPSPSEPDPSAHVTFFPEDHLYGPYLADPWMHGFSSNIMNVTRREIDDTGSPRLNMKLGGSLAFMRLHAPGGYDSGWQLSIDAGFNSQFDMDEGYDLVGWDGVAAILVTKRLPHGLSLRLSPYMHRSGHIGDELIENTGRKRIEYTREEYTAGLSWGFLDRFRIYGDAGYAFTTRSDVQEIWRAQGGAEYRNPDLFRPGKAGIYAAVNATSFQEKDWQADYSAAAGFLFPRVDRTWRLGVLYHHGSVPLGEFFADDETFISLGAWLDL